jgi:hypothetical protein
MISLFCPLLSYWILLYSFGCTTLTWFPQQREILEVLAQSQDDRDTYVTTQSRRKQRSRNRLPFSPIWFGIISGAVLLSDLFVVMIGFLCTLPFLPKLRSLVTRPCQRLFRNAPPSVFLFIISNGITCFEWISTSSL